MMRPKDVEHHTIRPKDLECQTARPDATIEFGTVRVHIMQMSLL